MCDTLTAPFGGGRLLAKNSDREPNEAQTVEFHPGGVFPAGAELACTYSTIPQASRTRDILISRPFWMWGAEMGVNDAGVAIGNEAIWTREPKRKRGGLTGMDLVRLALERSGSAAEAVEVITDLLAEFGQGGNCGYANSRFYYHNSFLIVDCGEAWVLETAGRFWAARRTEGHYAISNAPTIRAEFDRSHPELISHARSAGLYRSKGPFDFRRVYGEGFYRFMAAADERRSLANAASIDITEGGSLPDVFAALRDHVGSDPLRGLRGRSVCAHAANGLTRDAGQTVASMVVLLRPQAPPEVWVTATAAPCTSIFKPLAWGVVPPTVGSPAAAAGGDSLWWRHERLHREILKDYPRRIGLIAAERDILEDEIIQRWDRTPAEERQETSAAIFREADAVEEEWLERLRRMPAGGFSRYWRRKNREAGLK